MRALHETYHQRNEKFGETTGIQCKSNAFYTIAFSLFKNVWTWTYFDLDHTINKGDNLMECLRVHEPLDELPLSVKLKECDLEFTMLQHYSNRFSKFDLSIDHKELSSTKEDNGAIFTCTGISVALIWGKKSVFLVSSHSRNSWRLLIVEVVNNEVIYSSQLLKVNDVSHNNEEIPALKPAWSSWQTRVPNKILN